MKISKQRQILLGVLGLGIVVFAIDRFVLGGGPAPAGAAPYAAAASSADSLAASSPLPALVSLPAPNPDSIARRLAQYAKDARLDTADVREAFKPSEAWVPRNASTPGVTTVPLEVKQDPRLVFTQRHRLSAILGSGPTAVAIVDDVPLRPGEAIDGFILEAVTERAATFASPAGRVELRLPQ